MPAHLAFSVVCSATFRGPRQSAASSDSIAACRNATPRVARQEYGFWKEQGNRSRELREFALSQGDASRMPTERELRMSGRTDLSAAVRRHGGWELNAREAGLVLTSIARPRSIFLTFCTQIQPGSFMKPHNYWTEFENLRDELVAFMRLKQKRDTRQKHVRESARILPTTRELEDARRHDLVRAIRRHGGAEAVAKRMDLRFRYHSPGYWKKFENVEKVRTPSLCIHSQAYCPRSPVLFNTGLTISPCPCVPAHKCTGDQPAD
jgi:hypothetical protein